MRLADLQVVTRPRPAWEAVDLGVRLVQREAGLLWRAWLRLTLPVLLAALLLGHYTDSVWASLLLWWLKPVYDYALLIVLSRRVFGETPDTATVLRTLAAHWRGITGWLTWHRLSMSRAYLLPVWLLENLPARERQARIALLRRHHSGRARWLHTVMVHFEMLLALGLLSLLFWFAPEGHRSALWSDFLGEKNALLQGAETLAYYLAISLVELFYVAAGFMLYLNRRTELEAWDLEIAFRHLRERLDAVRTAPQKATPKTTQETTPKTAPEITRGSVA